MANFWEGVGNALMHPVNEAKWMFDSTKDVLKGDMKLKDVPGSHQEMMNDITVPILGDNKLAKNSDAVAGAVVGGILAAPLLAGAGGGAAGSAGAGGSGAGGSLFSLGDVTNYFKPGAGGGGANSPIGDVSTWNKIKGKASGLFDMGEKDLGALYKDVDFDDPANDEILGMISDVEDEIAAGKADEKGVDWDAVARMLQTIKPNDEKINLSGGRVGGGFRFDRKPYENQLLTREYENLYNQPLYNKLT